MDNIHKLYMISKIRIFFSSLHRRFIVMLPDEFSKYRVRYYRKRGNIIENSVSIASNVVIKGKIELGKNSSIAQNCTLSGENVGIYIGSNVMIAPNVVIIAFNHGYDVINIPMRNQKNNEAKVVIENDVWISSNCTIGKGVTIGEGSIIAANSFVNRSVPKYSIYGGVPAKLIKVRNSP